MSCHYAVPPLSEYLAPAATFILLSPAVNLKTKIGKILWRMFVVWKNVTTFASAL
jgi:hypothetical protein